MSETQSEGRPSNSTSTTKSKQSKEHSPYSSSTNMSRPPSSSRSSSLSISSSQSSSSRELDAASSGEVSSPQAGHEHLEKHLEGDGVRREQASDESSRAVKRDHAAELIKEEPNWRGAIGTDCSSVSTRS